MLKKCLVIAFVTSMPSMHLYTWNLRSEETLRGGICLCAAVVATSALCYTWNNKNVLQKKYYAQIGKYDALVRKYDDRERKFKDHQLLSDFYESTLGARTEFMPYAKILEQDLGGEEKEKLLWDYLVSELFDLDVLNTDALKKFTQQQIDAFVNFTQRVLVTKQDLEKKDSELSQLLVQWEHNDVQALLIQQGVHIRNTFARTLSVLDVLQKNITYIDALFVAFAYQDDLMHECRLEKHFSDKDQLAHHLDELIRREEAGERYPYRTYAEWIDETQMFFGHLNEELEKFTYYEFQQPAVTYITSTYAILNAIKEQIAHSPEYLAESAECWTEELARLKANTYQEELGRLRSEVNSLKRLVSYKSFA